jgi:hypothetical protein
MAFLLYAIVATPDTTGVDTDAMYGHLKIKSVQIGSYAMKSQAESDVEKLEWTYVDAAETEIVTADKILGFKILEVP